MRQARFRAPPFRLIPARFLLIPMRIQARFIRRDHKRFFNRMMSTFASRRPVSTRRCIPIRRTTQSDVPVVVSRIGEKPKTLHSLRMQRFCVLPNIEYSMFADLCAENGFISDNTNAADLPQKRQVVIGNQRIQFFAELVLHEAWDGRAVKSQRQDIEENLVTTGAFGQTQLADHRHRPAEPAPVPVAGNANAVALKAHQQVHFFRATATREHRR